MTDMLGKEVYIGDQVVFTMPKYANLCVGTVHNITPRGITCRRVDVFYMDNNKLIPILSKRRTSDTEFLSRTKEQFAVVDKHRQYNE